MNKSPSRFLIILAFGLLLPTIGMAEAPVPARKESLETIQRRLDEQKLREHSLAEETKSIERELGDTKDRLVKLGHNIQSNEKNLLSLEGQMKDLSEKKAQIENKLKSGRASIARMILALERMRRTPPAAMVVKPGAPYKTAQTALLMSDIIPALNNQAETLKQDLANLSAISRDLQNKAQKAKDTAQLLQTEQKNLSVLLDKKESLYTDTTGELKQQQAKVKTISAQAENLQDLVQKLEYSRQEEKEAPKSQKSAKRIPEVEGPSIGRMQLPVPGIVRVGFDDPDSFGAPSKGISIEARSGALVVAPMGGKIMFAGAFKNYGQLVIIEHEKGYHSLIAGLEKIDTVVGHSVSAGEPLGFLHRDQEGGKPALYYELRYNGRPVNPAKKFAGLG